MKTLRRTQIVAALVVCLSWVVPLRDLAAAPPVLPAAGAVAVHDVALDAEGRLVGQAVDAQGRLLVAEPVVALQNGQAVSQTSTDQEGRFVITGLGGGLYQISTSQSSNVCRVWAPNTAPPIATTQLLLTASDDVQRGQRPAIDLLHPILIGLIIAAAIAIPIALHDDNDDAS